MALEAWAWWGRALVYLGTLGGALGAAWWAWWGWMQYRRLAESIEVISAEWQAKLDRANTDRLQLESHLLSAKLTESYLLDENRELRAALQKKRGIDLAERPIVRALEDVLGGSDLARRFTTGWGDDD